MLLTSAEGVWGGEPPIRVSDPGSETSRYMLRTIGVFDAWFAENALAQGRPYGRLDIGDKKELALRLLRAAECEWEEWAEPPARVRSIDSRRDAGACA